MQVGSCMCGSMRGSLRRRVDQGSDRKIDNRGLRIEGCYLTSNGGRPREDTDQVFDSMLAKKVCQPLVLPGRRDCISCIDMCCFFAVSVVCLAGAAVEVIRRAASDMDFLYPA